MVFVAWRPYFGSLRLFAVMFDCQLMYFVFCCFVALLFFMFTESSGSSKESIHGY